MLTFFHAVFQEEGARLARLSEKLLREAGAAEP